MSKYIVWDRNGGKVLGVYPSTTDADNALRRFKAKTEGKHSPTLVLERITVSDPDYAGGSSKSDK